MPSRERHHSDWACFTPGARLCKIFRAVCFDTGRITTDRDGYVSVFVYSGRTGSGGGAVLAASKGGSCVDRWAVSRLSHAVIDGAAAHGALDAATASGLKADLLPTCRRRMGFHIFSGKTSLSGELGSRYLVVKSTYDALGQIVIACDGTKSLR